MVTERGENINNTFFSGTYKEIWKSIFPPKITSAEVNFMITISALKNDSRILDLMCGHGRHTIELARKGYSVTAIDNLPDYTDSINQIAKNENLPIDCLTENILDASIIGNFDLAIC